MELALSTSFLLPPSSCRPKTIPSLPKPPPPPRLYISAVIRIDQTPDSTASTTPPPHLPNHNSRRPSRKRTKERSLLSTIFNAFDDFIIKFIDPDPLRPCFDPREVLSGNFAPVEELPPTECQVIHGTLPACLDGAYIRNGPNPQYFPKGPYHLFDGDGMLHSTRISNGRATFCSRYVKTNKYYIEESAGSPVIPNVFSGFNNLATSMARAAVTIARILTGQFHPRDGIGLANTSLAFFGNKLYALGESDLPYSVKLGLDGEITTVGRYDFDGKLSTNMTAHPKIDVNTGEVFAFRYNPLFPPFLTFFRFDKTGEKQPDVPIFSMTCPSFLHDFAITRNYALFAEIQIRMNPKRIIRGGSPVGADLTKVSRLGVIPKYAEDESEIRWFEVPGFNLVHAVNAWEEDDGDTVVLVAPNILSVEHTLERMDLMHSSMEKVKIDLKTGMVLRHPISTRNLDFGVIRPGFLTKKNRYVYAAVGDPMPKISGIVKLDLTIADEDRRECIVASHMYAPGCYGGEPFFVAREPDNPNAEEDDGYVVTYVHDENTRESRFIVMDARSSNLQIVAEVKLPRRVPYGFHGLFVPERDLNKLTNKDSQHLEEQNVQNC